MTRDDIQDLIEAIPTMDGYETNATLQDIESALVQQASMFQWIVGVCEEPEHRTKYSSMQMCQFLDSIRSELLNFGGES